MEMIRYAALLCNAGRLFESLGDIFALAKFKSLFQHGPISAVQDLTPAVPVFLFGPLSFDAGTLNRSCTTNLMRRQNIRKTGTQEITHMQTQVTRADIALQGLITLSNRMIEKTVDTLGLESGDERVP